MTERVKQWLETGGKWLTKFKYPALLLVLGLILAFFPFQKKAEPKVSAKELEVQTQEATQSDAPAFSEQNYLAATEAALADILSQVDGAGRVRVMLTLKTGSAVSYQTDVDTTTQNSGDTSSETVKQTTVIISGSGAYNEAAVVKTEYPVFQGALIVSEGAGNPSVCLALKNAVSALLGIGTDKITVVKMK